MILAPTAKCHGLGHSWRIFGQGLKVFGTVIDPNPLTDIFGAVQEDLKITANKTIVVSSSIVLA